MGTFGRIMIATVGFGLGTLTAVLYMGEPRPVEARTDRYHDFIIATGAATTNARVPTDGVWLLDYRSGKLLGTVIDRNVGRVVGWAEVDLVEQFQIQPGEDVHFMMTTGNVARGQAALYLAEVKTGKFGVFTMGPGPLGQGIQIYRNDLTTFRARQPVQPGQPVPAAQAINPPLPNANNNGGMPVINPVRVPGPARPLNELPPGVQPPGGVPEIVQPQQLPN